MKVWKLFILLLFLSPVMTLNAQDQPERTSPPLIAFIGADFNVYALDPQSEDIQELTSDAGEALRYQWPTWSKDGRLAYFSTALTTDNELSMSAFVSPDGKASGSEVYTGLNEIFQYANWAPQNCAVGDNCRDLAVLLSSPDRGLLVEMIRDTSVESSSKTVGTGAPFYQSWSPDGSRMLWQRNQQTLDIYDVATDEIIETLDETPGFIQAPAWSPVDDRLLFGRLGADGQSTDLVISGNDEIIELSQGVNGLITFEWSPDGNYVAYRTQTGASAFGSLIVVDAVTGETVTRSITNGVIGFFWSPNSSKIAYVTLATPAGSFNASSGTDIHTAALAQQPVGLSWSVLQTETGATNRYGSFAPTQEMLYLLQYFDQFHQSHRIWSPDSKHILYSELTDNGPVISLLDTDRADSVPFSVAAGIIGVWSY